MHGVHHKPLSTWMLLGGLYVTQYLGVSFFIVALVAILREQGASLERISLIYLLGMLGACKFLWAPAIDRFHPIRRWGHYQGWLLLMQSSLVAGLFAIGSLNVITDFAAIYILCLLVTFFCATQDIAVDGLSCRLLTPAERGIGNGLQTAGGLLSYLIGGGLALILYPHIGWRNCLWMLAACTALSLAQLLFFKEPTWAAASRPTPWQPLRFFTFWQRERGGGWLLVLLFYSMGTAIAYSILIPMLIDVGWTIERIGLLVNVLGSVAGFVAALLTGWLIRHISRHQAMLFAALLQVVAVSAIALPVLGHTGEAAVALAVCVYFFCYNPAMAVISTLIMDHASPETPATDYTLQFGMYQLSSMALGAGGVYLAGRLGYAVAISVAVFAALLAVVLSLRYAPQAQEIVQHEGA